MGMQIVIKGKPFFKRLWHKLFKCPTFWKLKSSFTCPICGAKYRCYWDGNDVLGFINVCMRCFPVMNKIEELENQDVS